MSKENPSISETAPKAGSRRWFYHILAEPESPSKVPHDAVDVKQFERPAFLFPDDPSNFMVSYGFGEWERELTDRELKEYNMLPMDYDQGLLFRLRQEFDGDLDKMYEYCDLFFNVVQDDSNLVKFDLLKKLKNRKWTLKEIQADIKTSQQVK